MRPIFAKIIVGIVALAALAALLISLPITASSAATSVSAKTKPVAGTFQLAATSHSTLKGGEVKFVVTLIRNNRPIESGTGPNFGNGEVAVVVPAIRAGDVVNITIKPHATEFGNKRSKQYTITKTDARNGVVKEIELPTIHLPGPVVF